jgi:CelD/BcsL family acetyltransferase involved in cellulose biosynthesis
MMSAGEGCFSLKLAYDEAHEKSSPGMLAEVDNVRQFMETPGPRWLDSNTSRDSQGYGRVWKDCRTVQRIAVGASGIGRLAVTALPFMRLAKHFVRGLRPVRSGRDDARQAA